MTEREELVARLRECHATTHTRGIIDAAADMGNLADCQHETMIERLRTAGVVQPQGATA